MSRTSTSNQRRAQPRAGANLTQYGRKRRFDRTAEPAPKAGRTKTGRSFVIQKHDASRLHYDFRLEHDDVLKSWAIPKGPSLDPSQKVLAVEVEDHPVAYGSFEGTIPEGQYGGGTVLLWDNGTWEPIGDPDEGLRTGKLKFKLRGQKLRGGWTLVRMHGRPGDDNKKNWLLIKEKDEEAKPLSKGDVRTDEPLSVATGRDLSDIAAAEDRVWNSRPTTAGRNATSLPRGSGKHNRRAGALTAPARSRSAGLSKPPRKSRVVPTSLDTARAPGAAKSNLPKSPLPELATLVDKPPEGENWLHEIKFDGYRVLCRIDSEGVQLLTRRANDWTHRFKDIADAAKELPVTTAIFDGEVVVLDQSGRSDFQSLQNALKGLAPGAKLHYFVFDLLHFNGYDLSAVPLLARKQLLQQLLATAPTAIRYSDHVQGRGHIVIGQACTNRLEGIVSKRADSFYQAGRTRDWLKIKCINRQEFVIGGYSDPAGARAGFGALLLGVYDDGKLRYCGRVGTGFDQKQLASLLIEMKRHPADHAPFINPPRGADARGVHWLSPALVAEVQFTEWTKGGTLRHPSFQGVREDKDPKAVVREKPAASISKSSSSTKSRDSHDAKSVPARLAREPIAKRAAKSESATVAGVTISHPDRVLYPEAGITKLDLARYYESIKDWVLPHMAGRPLTLVRCPQGRNGPCFYQKHIGDHLPTSVRGLMIREKDGKEDQYLVIDNITGLIALVQLGVLEFHPWGCLEDDVEKPDRLIIDLDPGPGVTWPRIVAAARLVRERLEDSDLASFVKTTGGKGLHVVIPLQRRATWDQVKAFTKTIADGIVRDFPTEYTAIMTKSRRQNKIFIDYLRNGRGATAIAPYSTRASDKAPIATPLTWDELSPKIEPSAFTLKTIPQRLAKLKRDPWADLLKARQSITASMLKNV